MTRIGSCAAYLDPEAKASPGRVVGKGKAAVAECGRRGVRGYYSGHAGQTCAVCVELDDDDHSDLGFSAVGCALAVHLLECRVGPDLVDQARLWHRRTDQRQPVQHNTIRGLLARDEDR